ncbi:MAG: hypothetical protein ACLR1T_11845 [Evtepia gabavorous]
MYTMKILEREPALSHFLSAHLPPQWGRAPVLCPGGAGRSGGGLPRPYPGPIRSHRLPGPAGARFPGPSGGRTLRGLGGELRPDPRDTLTFSSLGQDTLCLALQRELVTLSGDCLEPQEWPLPRQSQASPLFLLACAGLQLLLGVPPAEVRLGRGSGASLST